MWNKPDDLNALAADQRVFLMHLEGELSVGAVESDPTDPTDMSKDRLVSFEKGLSPITGWMFAPPLTN